MSLAVRLNGEQHALPHGSTVVDAVVALTGSGSVTGVAVAVNEQVVPRSSWSARPLAEGDRVEVLTAVQGG